MMVQWLKSVAARLVRWLAHRWDLPQVSEAEVENEPPWVRHRVTDAYLDGVQVGIEVGENLAATKLRADLILAAHAAGVASEPGRVR